SIARRKDDEPEAIRQRIASFYEQTIPVIDWYRSQNRLLEVEADLEPTEIHQNICQKLEYYQ
nr:hypothetical protein [Candidatus Gracilibacteria bacterium]